MMDYTEHLNFESWVKHFAGTAILGFICTFLIIGKFLHHAFQHRGLLFGFLVVPPSLISGILGLISFAILEKFDLEMTASLTLEIESFRANLINFVFAALILGLTCTRKSSQHTSLRAVVTSLLHEGMPMVIYSQILIWGQSTCCLAMICVLNTLNAGIPKLFAAMVPLGVEAGEDVIIAPVYDNNWSKTVVQEAESLGLVAACLLGVTLVNLKPFLVARGWLTAGHGLSHVSQAGQAEAFERSSAKRAGLSKAFVTASASAGDIAIPAHYSATKSEDEKSGYASLGAHISLIALPVFMSFGVSLLFHLLEAELNIENHFLSGIRLFKLSMCCALVSMHFVLSKSRIRFNRDWFMRLCGLMLDLLVISSLAVSYPKPQAMEKTHYFVCGCFVAICLAWNLFCFIFVARQLFPNFWFTRALTLTGDSMGQAYTGLLLARTLDPAMESPVPAAYASKLMLLFIPSSGCKNAIVVSIVGSKGAFVALVVTSSVVASWYLIFEAHFRHRFIARGQHGAVSLKSPRGRPGDGGSSSLDSLDLSDPAIPTTDPASAMDAMFESATDLLDFKDSPPPSASRLRGEVDGLDIIDGSQTIAIRRIASASALSQTAKSSVSLSASSEPSALLSADQMRIISAWMPDTIRSRTWTLSYSLRRDGASLDTLIALATSKVSKHSACVMVVEDSWGYIFGGFMAHALENRSSYYGNGECFVFTIAPTPQVFRWTGKNSFFTISSTSSFAMGGGGDGFALQLDDELDTGVSNSSATFENKQLASSEFFKCLNVELWTMDTYEFSV